jgi:hypothetical protein
MFQVRGIVLGVLPLFFSLPPPVKPHTHTHLLTHLLTHSLTHYSL